MNTSLSENAKESLAIIEEMRENGHLEEYEKYEQAASYIKKNGIVSRLFLDRLRTKREQLRHISL